ncbi:CLUMA_CG002188, isoform A [Clunio marinus]|uniref:CLUMA_CG002188, isoform A n=1 Tax=Clunio marinus TaxID=568069 RepID=A0A1J1HQC1_9DIPT|nr:CLUMA_CG002188, isoform A [Clunio marinus]
MFSISDRVTVIDGGFSTQLMLNVGVQIDGDPLWSARFNSVQPDAVVKSHLDFLENGAEIILTNTYQASVEGYTKHLNINREESIDLIKKTVKLAHNARDNFMQINSNTELPLIFASIGPYGAHLHDGSEYTGSYADTVSVETIKNWHKVRINACIEAGVDGLAIETIPCQMEAEAVVDMILDEHPDMKFWVSFQCKDGNSLAHGEKFADAVDSIFTRVAARNKKNLVAVGINCINSEFVSQLLRSIKVEVPLVVYPNSGETYNVETGWQGKNSYTPLEDFVHEWIELGARFIGGCCRIDASDIKKIKEKVQELKK